VEVASIGPRPGGRGSEFGAENVDPEKLASIGPRPGGRGSEQEMKKVTALAELQLGRDQVVADRRRAVGAWTCGSSFNWAATRWYWSVGLVVAPFPLALASIGPRPGGRGSTRIRYASSGERKLQLGRDQVVADRSGPSRRRWWCRCFNWAATRWSRI